MVLAIGVVVDDAIVVVENVERVMEEEPDLPPAEATRKAMRQITGPIIAISLVLLSVFVPVGFIPGLSGTLFRQFAVTISCAMLISAINALTLSPALCAVFLRHHGQRRGADGAACCAASTTCATATPGWCSAWCASRRCRCWRSRCSRCGIVLLPHAHADRLPAGGRPGRVLHRRATARRRLGGAQPPRWRRGSSKS